MCWLRETECSCRTLCKFPFSRASFEVHLKEVNFGSSPANKVWLRPWGENIKLYFDFDTDRSSWRNSNIALQRTWQAKHEIQVGDIFKRKSSTKLRLLLAKPLTPMLNRVPLEGKRPQMGNFPKHAKLKLPHEHNLGVVGFHHVSNELAISFIRIRRRSTLTHL
ncbi:MAG: hypothetical protein ONB44_06300 [candidate division KSB1 bacterium]|nr:hypothetical protein [candidate division KSB1 bacterium]MDZ7301734.1 hypothetical protein [candidate division KSB1 bacterium]MDZ7311487.1 hypothetical protein [candidate division KSB1 bacterium]